MKGRIENVGCWEENKDDEQQQVANVDEKVE